MKSMVGVMGFSFSGRGQNAGLAFVTLKDWDERARRRTLGAGGGRPAFGALSGDCAMRSSSAQPAPIPELGTASGFTFRLQDRGGRATRRWSRRATSCSAWPRRAKILAGVRPDGWKMRRNCR